MRIAVLGDIHGNLFGLQAVLAALRADSPDTLIISGDLVYKFPWGAEVVDLLAGLPCQAILGNAELYVLLWGTELWPDHWQEPLMIELVQVGARAAGPFSPPLAGRVARARGAERGPAGRPADRPRRSRATPSCPCCPDPARIARRGCRRTTVCASCWAGSMPM